MARKDAQTDFYLPPLDKCLNEGWRLISFKCAFESLSEYELASATQNNLRQFLNHDQTIGEIVNQTVDFKSPTSQTKDDFNSRTAQINATPSDSGSYDIGQIKDDALWISQITGIDEISALRIVVLEWQERTAAKVLEGYTEEEALSIRQAIQNVDFSASISTLGLPPIGKGEHGSNKFDLDENRRLRLLRTLLSEKECALGVGYLAHAITAGYAPKEKDDSQDTKVQIASWLYTATSKIRAENQRQEKMGKSQSCVQATTAAVRKAIEAWESGNNWTSSFEDQVIVDQIGRDSELKRIHFMLQSLFVCLIDDSFELKPRDIDAWFTLVGDCLFLEQLQPQSPAQQPLIQPIQAMVSLISLQLLQLPNILAHLHENSPSRSLPPLLEDVNIFSNVDKTLAQAADRASPIASPALFTWSMICQTMKGLVETHSDDDASLTDGYDYGDDRHAVATVPRHISEALDAVLRNPITSEPIKFYAITAVDTCSVLNVVASLAQGLGSFVGPSWSRNVELESRLLLLELVRHALRYVPYSSDILEALIALLDLPNTPSVDAKEETLKIKTAMANHFINDKQLLVPKVLHEAQWRYPYELTPFLKLFEKLAAPEEAKKDGLPHVLPLSEPTSYFTKMLPHNFYNYENTREDENTNGIKLTSDLPLVLRRQFRGLSKQKALATIDSSKDNPEVGIPRGTIGFVIDESKPVVVAWEHTHSPLKYLGCLLATTVASSERTVLIDDDSSLDLDTQADIINLFNSLIKAYSSPEEGIKDRLGSASPALWVLGEVSDLLGNNQDIITVIFEIFERELTNQTDQNDESRSNILCSCLGFFTAAMKVVPGRIWPLLARSELLEIDGKGGRINNIIALQQFASTRQSFVSTCLELFGSLTKDIKLQSVSSKTPSTTIARRFETDNGSSTGLPQKVMEKILLSFTRVFLDLFQPSANTPIESDEVRSHILSVIIEIFYTIIHDTYAFDDSKQPDSKLCGAFAPAAKFLLDTFLTPSDKTLSVSPLLITFSTTTDPLILAASPIYSRLLHEHIHSTINFLILLLRVSVLLDTPKSHLEKQLFRILPLLARRYVSEESFKKPIVVLLKTMVERVGMSQKNPPSLMGSLGTEAAKSFLSVLSNLAEPLDQENLSSEIWALSAAIICNRQSWCTTFLITGDLARESFKRKEDDPLSRKKALFSVALDTIIREENLETRHAFAVFDFIQQALNQNPSLAMTLHTKTEFLQRCTDLLHYLLLDLNPHTKKSSQNKEVKQTFQFYSASLIANVLSLYSHHLRQLGVPFPLKDFYSGKKLKFYREYALVAPSYNTSLHQNLKRNFEQKFPSCPTIAFKRILGPRGLGDNYFFDLPFASEVLSFHQVWDGSGTKSGKGFKEEFRRANINLSLVESQIQLLTSYKSLAIELSHAMQSDRTLQREMVDIVKDCLNSNIESQLPDINIFENLSQTRANLALVILQRLIALKSSVGSIKNLLTLTWDTLQASGQDFDIAYTDKKTEYYRTLCQILYLAIQPHIYLPPSTSRERSTSPADHRNSEQVDQNDQAENHEDELIDPNSLLSLTPTLHNVVKNVVAKSFISLCVQLHNAPSSDPNKIGTDPIKNSQTHAPTVLPSDFQLVTQMISSLLRIPNLLRTSNLTSSITTLLADSDVHRYALALFSWSSHLPSPYMSHTDNESEHDPFYGTVAVSIFKELSVIPEYSQFLATESILSQLNDAQVLIDMRDNKTFNNTTTQVGMNLDKPQSLTHQQIWMGILEICLNILLSVGAPVATEILGFLHQFSSQFRRASSIPLITFSETDERRVRRRDKDRIDESFEGGITMQKVKEIHICAMIDMALKTVSSDIAFFSGSSSTIAMSSSVETSNAGNSVGVGLGMCGWDQAGVKEDVEKWVLPDNRQTLGDRLIPLSVREREGRKSFQESVVRELEGLKALLQV